MFPSPFLASRHSPFLTPLARPRPPPIYLSSSAARWNFYPGMKSGAACRDLFYWAELGRASARAPFCIKMRLNAFAPGWIELCGRRALIRGDGLMKEDTGSVERGGIINLPLTNGGQCNCVCTPLHLFSVVYVVGFDAMLSACCFRWPNANLLPCFAAGFEKHLAIFGTDQSLWEFL